MDTKPIKRAVIMLDQSSGELREDQGTVFGLDLWLDTVQGIQQLNEDQIEVTLALSSESSTDDLQGASAWVPGLKILVVSNLYSIATDEEFTASLQLPTADAETAFVSSDRNLRGKARVAGLQPTPHSALLPFMARGMRIEAVRISGSRDLLKKFGNSDEVVPMHFQPTCRGSDWALIALVTESAKLNAIMQNLSLQIVPYDFMMEDLIWARVDSQSKEIQEALLKRKILHAEPGQVLLSMKPNELPESLNLHGGHGHIELLMPNPNLLREAPLSSQNLASFEIRQLPKNVLEKVKVNPRIRDILLLTRPLCGEVTATYGNNLDRYTGIASLDDQGTIISRHSAHPDNKRVEAALMSDLKDMGYCPYRHNFVHAGSTHSNIIADLPGRGVFRIKAEILEKYRKIIQKHPIPDVLTDWRRELEELSYTEWFQKDSLMEMSELEIRRRVEKIFSLQPWYPWWKKACLLYGLGADIVVVGCHFDSTAGFESGYSAQTDAAPGADDNGSGVAATLSMAHYFRNLAGKLTHTVRFCFFNTEESGLVGSKAYASKMKSLNAPIRAVICTDMMGYNADANRFFEVHAGFTDPDIRDLSLPVASEVANAAAAYGKLPPAQIYKGTSWNGAPDRDVYDGGINRSDHAAFHQQGYGAVLVSEDFFSNLVSEPGADPNPNYHRQSDTVIDIDYAKDITCAINKAVINLAL
jgi:hypothetical protein